MAEPATPVGVDDQPTDIRRSPPAIEPIVVFGAAVALPLGLAALSDDPGRASTAFTNAHLLSVLVAESILTLALLPWLVRRGWNSRAIAGTPDPYDALRGAGVWLLAYACVVATWIPLGILEPEIARTLVVEQPFTGAPASTTLALLVSVLNPVFEEFLWLGYGIARLAPRIGLRWSAVLSVVLRTALHAYQGPWALLGILPLGIAFTWYYGRTKRIWPVIFAHILFDAIALAQRAAAP